MFNTVIVDDSDLFFNTNHKPLFRQCEHNQNSENRCGANAMFCVTYPVLGGEKQNIKHLCDFHTNEIIRAANRKNMPVEYHTEHRPE